MKTMFIKLLSLFSILLLMSFNSDDCSILKNNIFTYKSANREVIVVFNGNKHIEYHNNKEFYIKSDIKWISDCEYYLTIKETTLPKYPYKMGTVFHFVVNKVKNDKVFFTCTLGEKSWEGKLKKLQ